VFGELKIVPSAAADLGELGPHQGQGTSYDWKWYYSASGLFIWLALILAFVVPKANHDLHILWILVPLAIVNLLWLAFKKLSGMPSSAALQFDTAFRSAAVGVTVLWLVANYAGRFAGFVRFLLFFGILMVVTSLGILSYSTEFSNETTVFLAVFVFTAVTLLVAMTLSQRFCGGTYRPVRFMLWLVLWTVLASWVAMVGFVVAVSIITSSWPGFPEGIWIVVLGGLMFAAHLYVLNFPFMILSFVNPFFRERLFAGLHLKLMPVPAGSDADSGRPNVQDAGAEAR